MPGVETPARSHALSIVVPVYDEAESLRTLHQQIRAAVSSMADAPSWELVFINDGSRDSSGSVLDAIAAEDDHVRVLHFRRNFGKSPALAAGFDAARGEIVITMDADLQDDPVHIPEFIERVQGGADLVSGWKRDRLDPADKRWPSRLFNAVVRRLSGIRLHDFNCGFKAYHRDVLKELSVYGGLHRFLPVLAGARGFRVEELVVKHRAREHGRSKFGNRRLLDGLLDLLTVLLLTRFRTRPLHFFGIPGLVLGGAGLAILSYLSILWFMGEAIGTRPLLSLGVLLVITGGQFLSMGLLGELLVRTTIAPGEVYSLRTRALASEVSTQAAPVPSFESTHPDPAAQSQLEAASSGPS